ncbi:MAG TPA: ABC transporter ATP-binding protein [Actinophytocola sp.]|uniref:ABC transporter ATP-binding protein n=1 Tax=Actinophytocola sp. TaxID=1872138 RepID=UPI002DC0452E|nr:ABC transporter ATP-binding protein [Actinophytocola sp.]HEU5473710.1 ABC transporter ATP-binding protein [Actinophytocola sp.]
MTLGIEVTDLRLNYGTVTALDGLTFSLSGGRIYGLLGRNGSGKTSLMSVLAAFRKASAGTVLIDGQPVWENPAITRQVCLIRTNVDTLGSTDRISAALDFTAWHRPSWDAEFAATLLDRFRLSARTKIGALSRGQRSVLGAVLGLASRAPVTMFDESHLGMDAPTRYAFYDTLLTDFIAHPRTIIVSTHLIEEVSPLFERVLIIDNGRLVLHEDADALRARGVAVTGPADAVDRLVAGHTVLGEKSLGPTKSAMVFGPVDDAFKDRARRAGLELGPIGLQDLFVHLTEPAGESR